MFFEYPKLLWLLAVPAVLLAIYVLRLVRKRCPHLRVSAAAPWLQRRGTLLQILSHLPMALFTAAMALLAVVLARPRSSSQVERLTPKA